MNIFETTAKLTMDISEFIKGLKNAQSENKKSLDQYRKDVMDLAQQYKKSGMDMSEAMKRAYAETDKSLYNLGKDADSSGNKVKSFGDVFKTVHEKASSAFSGIKSITETAGNSISIFGDVLKANLASDVIEKSAESIVSAFQKIGSAATGFVKDSVSTGMNFDTAMSQVAATMGKSVDEIQNLRDFAKEMGATTKYSATESAEALNFMALAGYDAETSMAMLPNVMNLASAGAFDLARASDMITDTQTAFGISIERTTQMVDEMAKAASTGNTSVAQLGDAFLTVGGLAKELNGGFVTLSDGTTASVDGIQELEIALTAMANAGVKGSEAGTHMRNLLMKLASPTEDATKLFEELGVSVFDDAGNMKSLKDIFGDLQNAFVGMNDQQKKLQAISEIFNARDTASATALLDAIEQSWDNIGESILNAEGAAGRMAATQIKNLEGWKTMLASAKEGFQIGLSDMIKPMLTEFVKFGAEGFQGLTDAINQHGVSGLSDAIANIMKNGSRTLRINAPKLLKLGTRIINEIQKGIIKGIPETTQNMKELFDSFSKTLSVQLPKFAKNGAKIMAEFRKSLSKNIPVVLPAVTKIILSVTDELTKPEMIAEFVNSGISLLTGLADGLAESASILIERVPDIVENLKQGFSDNKDKIKVAGETILSAFTEEFGEFSFSGAVDSLISNFSKAIESQEWKNVTDKISKGIQNIDFTEVTRNLSKLIIGITDSTGKLVDGIDWSVIGSAIAEGLNGVDFSGIAGSILNLITTAIKNSPELLKGIAETIDSETAVQMTTLGVNLLLGKHFVGALATYLTSETALASVAPAMGTLFSKCAPAIGAAIVGWDIGTLIYNANKDSIDEGLAKIIDDAKDQLYTLKALWDWTFNNPEGLSVQQLYRNIALDATASGVGFQSDKYRQMVADWGEEDIYESFGSGNGMNFNAFEDSVKQKLDTVKWLLNDTANSEEIKNAGKTLADNFGSGIAESAKGAESMADIVRAVKKAAGIDADADGLNAEMKTSGENMTRMFADGISNNSGQVESSVNDMTQFISDNLEHHSPAKAGNLQNDDTWMPNMMQMFADGIKDNIHLVENNIISLTDKIKNKISSVVDAASSWGWDMLANFNNGIVEAYDSVIQTVANVASSIKSYLGFSEPEKGALSDFHTYAPDMMKLFAQGIKENQNLVISQAETLSNNLADTIQSPFQITVDSKFSGFTIPALPDSQNQEYTVTLLDNLDEIIQKTKEFVLSEKLPELSFTADTSTFDKIRELLGNPLVVSVQLSDSLEKLNSMFTDVSLESHEMNAVHPYMNGYTKQIDDIKNSYSTTNYYNNIENNSYSPSRNYTNESNGNSITVQNLTINVPGFNIESPSDMNRLGNALKDTIIEILDVQEVHDNRDLGGIGWQI